VDVVDVEAVPAAGDRVGDAGGRPAARGCPVIRAVRAVYGLVVMVAVMWWLFWCEVLACICRRRRGAQ